MFSIADQMELARFGDELKSRAGQAHPHAGRPGKRGGSAPSGGVTRPHPMTHEEGIKQLYEKQKQGWTVMRHKERRANGTHRVEYSLYNHGLGNKTDKLLMKGPDKGMGDYSHIPGPSSHEERAKFEKIASHLDNVPGDQWDKERDKLFAQHGITRGEVYGRYSQYEWHRGVQRDKAKNKNYRVKTDIPGSGERRFKKLGL